MRGGSLQFAFGLATTWTAPNPALEVFGLTLTSLGVNNIQSVFTGDTTIKDLANEKLGSEYAYTLIDIGFSLGLALPSTLAKTGSTKDLANGVTRYERNFDTKLGKVQAFVEGGVDANTILSNGE